MFKTLKIIAIILMASNAAYADEALNSLREIRITQGPQAALTQAQSLVTLAPRNAAYRFELGVIEAELGDCRGAWGHFENATTLLPVESVRRARDAAMQDLCPRLAPWEGTFNLGFVADENYNNMTTQETIDIGGLPFTLSEDSRAQERYGIDISGSIAYNHQIGTGHYIVPHLSGRLLLLNHAEDSRATLTPTLYYRNQNDRLDWRVGPSASFTFSQDGKEVQSFGIQGDLAYSLSPRSTIRLTGSAWDVDARNDREDGENYTLGLEYIRALENGNVLSLGLNGTQKNRELDQDTQSIIGASIAYRGALTQSIGFNLEAGISRLNADGPNPFFGTTREDTVATLTGAVSFSQFETVLGRPYIGVTYTNSSSNIVLHDYDKTTLRIGISRQF